jgi:hypothetical protein
MTISSLPLGWRVLSDHFTSLGYAVLADEIPPINTQFTACVPRPTLLPFFFNGNTPGVRGRPMSDQEILAAVPEIFTEEVVKQVSNFILPISSMPDDIKPVEDGSGGIDVPLIGPHKGQ